MTYIDMLVSWQLMHGRMTPSTQYALRHDLFTKPLLGYFYYQPNSLCSDSSYGWHVMFLRLLVSSSTLPCPFVLDHLPLSLTLATNRLTITINLFLPSILV